MRNTIAWRRLRTAGGTCHSAGASGEGVSCFIVSGPNASDRVLVAWARSPEGAADQPWHSLAALPARWSVPSFPLKAADLLARGVPKGPRLGAALRAAEDAWIAADFPSDALAVAAIADAAVRAG